MLSCRNPIDIEERPHKTFMDIGAYAYNGN